ncbi:MAG: glycosyltransferase family A protein [Bacteroidota bacterium]
MSPSSPTLSVIICSYNRDQFIGEALDSLTRQQLPKEQFEILIINNNSTDRTAEISQDFVKAHPELNARYFLETNQGLSFARNRGLKEAKGAIITYIDDDAIATPDFLLQIHQFMEARPEVAGVGGKVIPRYEIEEPKWMNKYLYGFVTKVDLGEKIIQYRGNAYPAGCNMTYRRALLEQVGGFNNELKWRADDKYIYFEICKLSDQVYYLPQAKVQHHIDAHRTSDENFVKLSKRFGSEERIRVLGLGAAAYAKKVMEFIYKFVGSAVLALGFAMRFQFSKGWYTFQYRYYALMALLGWTQP